MEQLFYWIGGIVIAIIGYFLKATMQDFKDHKKSVYLEIDKLKELSASNKLKVELLENDHSNKYNHLNQKLDELYTMLKDLIVEVKDLNKRIKI
jgi:hypothetical protein